jgi:hypothetical protein
MQAMRAVACDAHEEERMGASIKLHVLEAGVAVHSVIIGIAMGAEKSESAVTTLCVAITMHQLFEGMALGGLLASARLPVGHSAALIAFYAFATPIGIIAGMQGDWASPLAMGVFDMIAAGVLLHMALTDMLPHVSGTHAHHSHGLPDPGSSVSLGAVPEVTGRSATAQDTDATPDGDGLTVKLLPAAQGAPAVVTVDATAVGTEEDESHGHSHNPDHGHSHNHHGHAHAQGSAGRTYHNSTPQEADEADTSDFWFRLICWTAMLGGTAGQSLLAVWA